MDRTPFAISGPSHFAALGLTIAAAGCLVLLQRRCPRAAGWCRIALAFVLFAAVLADPVITYLRYIGEGSGMAWRKVNETAWPFYLCDWAAVICGLALLRRNQRLAEIGWCWGVGGTIQGLVYPASLSYDWPNPDWYAFFAEHGGVPVAGILLVFGLGLKPQPGVVWRAWLWLLAFLAFSGLVNQIFHWSGVIGSNYAFVCTSDYSPLGVLGPWPVYVLGMAGVLAVIFAVLTVPICGWDALRWGKRQPFLGPARRD